MDAGRNFRHVVDAAFLLQGFAILLIVIKVDTLATGMCGRNCRRGVKREWPKGDPWRSDGAPRLNLVSP